MWWKFFYVVFLRFQFVNLQLSGTLNTSFNLTTSERGPEPRQSVTLGDCKVVINELCPAPDVTFYLYSKKYTEEPEVIRVGSDRGVSNLSSSAFDPALPTKIVVHGYNSDMHINVLIEIKKQYLLKHYMNIFFVDWSTLAKAPCYLAAMWNIRHVGQCTAQLVQRIREKGSEDIHLIGFSLGGQLANYVANTLSPYKLPRITGLDPAGPGFLTASDANRLDKGDANFVDVIHTNALMQGIVEPSGHVDFYLNGGVIQPGCWAEHRFFACNHHRAPLYFAESINTEEGFWGWPCPSFSEYMLGRCPPKEPQIAMGDFVNRTSNGMHLVITDSVSPFAVGKFTGPAIEVVLKSEEQRVNVLDKYKREVLNMVDESDLMESLPKRNEYKTGYGGQDCDPHIDAV